MKLHKVICFILIAYCLLFTPLDNFFLKRICRYISLHFVKVIKFLLIIYLTGQAVNCFAQVKVKGVVKDKEKGEVLIGATVVLKGTTTGQTAPIRNRQRTDRNRRARRKSARPRPTPRCTQLTK